DGKQWRARLAEEGGFARIGLLKWPRDRIAGYRALHREIITLAPAVAASTADQAGLWLHVVTGASGTVRAALAGADRQPLPGYGFEDCQPLAGDCRRAAVRWQGSADLPRRGDHPDLVALVELTGAELYAFDFQGLS
ncbi:MAG: hypothetical protein ABIL09_06970, partial [Gemmatimonadota bacterium]